MINRLVITLALITSIKSFASTSGGPESVSAGRYQTYEGTKGMVVSDDRLASEWGAEILRKGGNAIDAAVAVAFTMAVTRPHYASLGGGGFLVFCPRPTPQGPSPCQTIDFREQAPQQAKRNMYIRNRKPDSTLSQDGALASGVPGITSGLLLALEKFGTLPRQKLLARPIEIAKKGYLFTTHSESAAEDRWSIMNDAAKEIFGCKDTSSGKLIPCSPGTRIIQRDLAKVLETISKKGKSGFYDGIVAQKIVDGIQKAGGILTLEDFRSFQPKLRAPLKSEFMGHEIISMPPPSSGGVVVMQLLNYADRAQKAGAFEKGFGATDSLHAMIHGMALAFSDRAEYLGDPDFVSIPVDKLLSSQYLNERWNSFKPNSLNLPPQPKRELSSEPQHTTHFSVIDKEGNAVAMTETVNENFGSGFVPPGTGIVMNDEMDDFSIAPGTPNLFGLVGSEANSIAARKRPLSSMPPTIVRDLKGNVQIAIGAAGGPRIITSVFQSLLNRYVFNMTLTDAVAAPRVHQQWVPEKVKMEKAGFSSDTRASLLQKGYAIEEVPTLGKIHAIERLEQGSKPPRTLGVPDRRGEGEAVAE